MIRHGQVRKPVHRCSIHIAVVNISLTIHLVPNSEHLRFIGRTGKSCQFFDYSCNHVLTAYGKLLPLFGQELVEYHHVSKVSLLSVVCKFRVGRTGISWQFLITVDVL